MRLRVGNQRIQRGVVIALIACFAGMSLELSAADSVLFVSNRDGGQNQIYKLDTANGAISKVTQSRGGNSQPAVSPDGKRVAFVSTRDGWPRVFMTNLDGSESVRIGLPEGTIELAPSWSPDGKSISFFSQNATSGEAVLKIVDVATGKALEVKGNGRDKGPNAPTWSADGSRIAFLGKGSQEGSKTEVFVVNRDGSNLLEISTAAGKRAKGFPALSPDGRKVVFVVDQRGIFDLVVANLDGDGNPVNLTNGIGLTHESPRWSPDGKQIVFASTREGSDRARIYVANSDGSSARDLSGGEYEAFDPRWSPDGKEIVFVALRGGGSQLFSVAVQGGAPRPLTPASNTFDTEPMPIPKLAGNY